MKRLVVLGLAALLSNGCGAVFDRFVPKHAMSGANGEDLVCVDFPDAPYRDPTGFAAVPILVAAVAPLVVGAVADWVVYGLETEASRYQASYSGRATSYLFNVGGSQDSTGSWPLRLRQSTLQLDRYYGREARIKGCPPRGDTTRAKEMEPYRVVHLEALITLSEASTLQITPIAFELKQAKAKVRASSGQVDVTVQVLLTGIVRDEKEGALRTIDLASVVFPIGKVSLDAPAKLSLSHLRSEHIPIPRFDTQGLAPVSRSTAPAERVLVPLNATVTVMEAEEFGDVMAKVAKAAADNRTKVVEAVLKVLGGGADKK